MRRNVFRALLPLMALPLMVACPFQQKEDDTEKDILTLLALPEQMEINGNWHDGFGTHNIQASKTITGEVSGYWNWGGSGTVLDFSNATRTAYVRTGVPSWCTNSGACECFDAGVCHNRNVWTKSGGTVYFCQIVYNKPTLDEARSDPAAADATDLASGCNGFAWSTMTPQ